MEAFKSVLEEIQSILETTISDAFQYAQDNLGNEGAFYLPVFQRCDDEYPTDLLFTGWTHTIEDSGDEFIEPDFNNCINLEDLLYAQVTNYGVPFNEIINYLNSTIAMLIDLHKKKTIETKCKK